MFNGITYRDFNKKFQTDEDCRAYLYNLKWKNGYCCRRCNHHLFYKGETGFHSRCRNCDYDESVTANTIFHKVKFPLLKAFGITFIIAVRKKGMSTLELSRSFSIRQTTAWLFKRKLQEAMKTKSGIIVSDSFECIEVQVGGGENEINSKFRDQSRQVLVACEKSSKTPTRAFAFIIPKTETTDLTVVKEKKTGPDSPVIPSESRSSSGNALQVVLKKHLYKKDSNTTGRLEIIVSNLKAWIRGIHHHCSGRFLQGYLDEFFYRFNRRGVLRLAWHQLIEDMISGQPYFYKANEV